MAADWQIIELHIAAPAKPDVGASCNGCGVCCATEPCPLGVLLSGRRTGACDALIWNDAASQYRCGAISNPANLLPSGLKSAAPLLARLARRWIAAGRGCDAALSAEMVEIIQRR